jgi:Ca2+-binding EF-hand superfamily protein
MMWSVPSLPMGSTKTGGKQAVTNDEVAAMLRALKLDKGFFDAHLRRVTEQPAENRRSSNSFAEELKGQRSQRSKTGTSPGGDAPEPVDFDIYLNEALMPVLAQSLDSLCRQVSRMGDQGDKLDPKVRERFNPLTFLAQQLLRRHPKCARTPRRKELYQEFHDWADFEHGRREMMRRKLDVMEAFSGFVLRGVVQTEDIPNVLKAIDDKLHVEGRLAGHKVMAKDFGAKTRMAGATGDMKGAADVRSSRMRSRSSFFEKSSAVGWEAFWSTFSSVLMSNDVVPYSALQRGDERKKEESEERARRADAQARLTEAQQAKQLEYQQQMCAYEELYARLKGNEQLSLILQENKILTGDDVRPKDAGYEFEVPPKGDHVRLLQELLQVLGLLETREVPRDGKEWWWTGDKAAAWVILQELHNAELADGVVERETLEKVMVPPVGFMALKLKIADELERRAESQGEMEHLKMDDMRIMTVAPSDTKPSYDKLCEMTGMSMARIEWLHQLFASYLEPDPDHPDALPVDNYPEDPASIGKSRMRELVMEVQPDLGDSEFEARFMRIDADGTGEVEFDEFVTWMHQDEIRVTGDDVKKMTFEELAASHDESVDVIMYLHTCFQDALPEGLVDAYPENPVALVKEEVKALALILTPNVSEETVEKMFTSIDAEEKGQLDFDEFLEVLDMQELPQELRERFSG